VGAQTRLALAAIDANAQPSWGSGEAFAAAFSNEQLADYLEAPLPLGFYELGVGLERIRNGLRSDLDLFRRAVERRDPRLARLGLGDRAVYATSADQAGNLFAAIERLRWSGVLAAAGFEAAVELE
jgi:hypothetical protein